MFSKRKMQRILIGIALSTLGSFTQAVLATPSVDPDILDFAIEKLGKYCANEASYKLSEFSYEEYEIDQGQWDAVFSLTFLALSPQKEIIGTINMKVVKYFQQNPKVSPLALGGLDSEQELCR